MTGIIRAVTPLLLIASLCSRAESQVAIDAGSAEIIALEEVGRRERNDSARLLFVPTADAQQQRRGAELARAALATLSAPVGPGLNCDSVGTCTMVPLGTRVVTLAPPRSLGAAVEITVHVFQISLRPSGGTFVGGSRYVFRIESAQGRLRIVSAQVSRT